MEPLPLTPMVRWSVEVKLSGTPVMVLPLVSITVAVVGWGVFGVTRTLVPPLAESVIDLGGQVWKTPALELVPAMLAEISAAPGCFAVARPFWSMETMLFWGPVPLVEEVLCAA